MKSSHQIYRAPEMFWKYFPITDNESRTTHGLIVSERSIPSLTQLAAIEYTTGTLSKQYFFRVSLDHPIAMVAFWAGLAW